MSDLVAPRFFVIWSRANRKFESVTLDSTGAVKASWWDVVVADRPEAKMADDLCRRLNDELNRRSP